MSSKKTRFRRRHSSERKWARVDAELKRLLRDEMKQDIGRAIREIGGLTITDRDLMRVKDPEEDACYDLTHYPKRIELNDDRSI